MTPLEVGLASSVVAVGAMLQGTLGFGLGLFSVPFLLLIEPDLIPGPLLTASLVLTLFIARRHHDAVQVKDLKWALSGRVVGVVAALAMLTFAPPPWIDIAFGTLILLAVGLSATGFHVDPAPKSLVGAGSLSGFMGTMVSIGGPPMALLYQQESGARIRGTLSAYFVFGVVMSLIGLRLIGRYGVAEFTLALGLAPGMLLGFLVSRHTARLLDRGYMRRAVLVVSSVAALSVIVKAVA